MKSLRQSRREIFSVFSIKIIMIKIIKIFIDIIYKIVYYLLIKSYTITREVLHTLKTKVGESRMRDLTMAKTENLCETPTRQRYVIAFVLLVVVSIAYIDRVNISILVADNEFLSEMGIVGQSVQKGLLMTSFLVAYGISNVILSPLGDWLGPRKAMTVAVVLWACSLMMGGLAATFSILIISRIFLGSGEGLHFPMQSKYIKNWFPPMERGKANSVWQVGMAIAPAVAMPLFTWIIYAVGWRSSFFVLTVIGIIPLILIWFFTTDTPQQSKRINEAELSYIEEALQKEKEENIKNGLEKTGLLENIKLFAGDYRFWLIVVYYIAHTSVIWGSATWLPTYLKTARGFSWAAMGALASLPWILGIFTKVASGFLADKFGRRAPLLLLAMVGVSVGVSVAALTDNNTVSATFLALGVGCIGFGGPAAWTLLQDIVPGKGISTAAGVMNGVGNGCSALAPVAIGFIIQMTGSYGSGLFYIVGCCVVGAVCTLILTLKKY
jgi:sugar phosphate permease